MGGIDESALDLLKFDTCVVWSSAKRAEGNDLKVLWHTVRTDSITQGYNKIRTKESFMTECEGCQGD